MWKPEFVFIEEQEELLCISVVFTCLYFCKVNSMQEVTHNLLKTHPPYCAYRWKKTNFYLKGLNVGRRFGHNPPGESADLQEA